MIKVSSTTKEEETGEIRIPLKDTNKNSIAVPMPVESKTSMRNAWSTIPSANASTATPLVTPVNDVEVSATRPESTHETSMVVKDKVKIVETGAKDISLVSSENRYSANDSSSSNMWSSSLSLAQRMQQTSNNPQKQNTKIEKVKETEIALEAESVVPIDVASTGKAKKEKKRSAKVPEKSTAGEGGKLGKEAIKPETVEIIEKMAHPDVTETVVTVSISTPAAVDGEKEQVKDVGNDGNKNKSRRGKKENSNKGKREVYNEVGEDEVAAPLVLKVEENAMPHSVGKAGKIKEKEKVTSIEVEVNLGKFGRAAPDMDFFFGSMSEVSTIAVSPPKPVTPVSTKIVSPVKIGTKSVLRNIFQ
jgi:hypothetical protein